MITKMLPDRPFTFESTIDDVPVIVYAKIDDDLIDIIEVEGKDKSFVLTEDKLSHELLTRLTCEAWGEIGMNH